MNIPENIFDCPDKFQSERNGLKINCIKDVIGQFKVENYKITVGDKLGISLFTPVKMISGTYQIVKYVWNHDIVGSINVGILIRHEKTIGGSKKCVQIMQTYAPHISDGIPVDSACISIIGGNKCFDIESGLGDGVYPVYGLKKFLSKYNSIYIDLMIWNVRRVIITDDSKFDKYQIAVSSSQ